MYVCKWTDVSFPEKNRCLETNRNSYQCKRRDEGGSARTSAFLWRLTPQGRVSTPSRRPAANICPHLQGPTEETCTTAEQTQILVSKWTQSLRAPLLSCKPWNSLQVKAATILVFLREVWTPPCWNSSWNVSPSFLHHIRHVQPMWKTSSAFILNVSCRLTFPVFTLAASEHSTLNPLKRLLFDFNANNANDANVMRQPAGFFTVWTETR